MSDGDLKDVTDCPSCGGRIKFNSPEYSRDEMNELLDCQECGAQFLQIWELRERERVDRSKVSA